MMKLAILGAGAMGCLYATYLAKNKSVDLTLFDHTPDKIDEINRDGLVMREDRVQKVTRVKAEVSGVEHEPVDILLLFVKAHQTYQALKANTSLIGEKTIVVSLQNGMGNYMEICKFVPLERIVIGTSNHNSTLLGYGKFFHAADGATIIGGFGEDDSKTSPVETIRSIFAKSRLDVSISNNVKRLIWRKLLVNMSINPLTMLMEVKNGFIHKDRHSWECVRTIVREGLAVAKKDGIDFDEEEILELVHKICQLTGSGNSSMFQDRIHKRRTEIDFINGSVVRLARKYGVEVPYNSLLTSLVHAVEDSYAGSNPSEE